MKKLRSTVFLSIGVLLIVLGLTTGCFKSAAPDVTPTLAGGVQVVEVTPNATEMFATAIANSNLATQPAAETPTVIVPTAPPPTAAPLATPIPPTPEPATLAPVADTPAPTATPAPTGQVTHVVQAGDNLFRIALRYGTTVDAIASANGIANPALIRVGQTLVIPTSGTQPTPQPGGETTYVVQAGDNLFRIALRYNLSYLSLAQYNNITDPARIQVGQVLRIPPH